MSPPHSCLENVCTRSHGNTHAHQCTRTHSSIAAQLGKSKESEDGEGGQQGGGKTQDMSAGQDLRAVPSPGVFPPPQPTLAHPLAHPPH